MTFNKRKNNEQKFSITYECSWWNGRSHDSKWFHENEIEVTLSEKTRIGFA
jgi:uncharacterized protein YodC (DUF2158 family)